MELLFVLGIVVAIIGVLYIQRRKDKSAVTAVVETPAVVAESAPYKVPEPPAVTTLPLVVEETTTPAPVAVAEPVSKGKKARTPRITSDPRDVDHDGVTSEEEKRAWALADARDTNHDGVISAEEKSVAKRAAKAARKPSSKKV
jgi:hypothetical protein